MLLELIASMNLATATCRQVTLPTVVTYDECQATARGVEFTRCSFGAAALTEEINDLIEERTRDEADYEDANEAEKRSSDCSDVSQRMFHSDASCELPFETGDVISVSCRSSTDSGAHPYGAPFAINVKVQGNHFREIKLRDLLVSDAAEARLWRLVRADLRKQLQEAYRDSGPPYPEDWVAERLGAAKKEFLCVTLSKAGLVISYDHYTFGYAVLDSTIPYRQLRGILLPKLLR